MLNERVVYISGGTSGINLGIAKGFAATGARVLVFGRDLRHPQLPRCLRTRG